MPTQTEQTILREAPQLEAIKLQLLKDAAKFAGKPLKLPESKVADFSGLQQATFDQANAALASGQGIGSYLDLLTTGQQGIGTGLETLRGAAPGLDLAKQQAFQSAGQYRPDDLSAFMDPFQQQVIDETMSELNRQAAIQQQTLASQALNAGAFGGSRFGVQAAELGRNQQTAQAQALAQLLSQNYGQALGASQSAFESGKAREAGLASLLAGITGQEMAVGQAEAQLAADQMRAAGIGQQMATQDLGTLQQLGGQQQLLHQAVLDAKQQNIARQQQEEAGRLGFLSDIYKGAPSTQMTLAQQSVAPPPSPSAFQQIAGIGTGLLSSVAAGKQAGIF